MTIECDPRSFPGIFRKHETEEIDHFCHAIVESARAGVRVVRSAVPVDLGGLRRETDLVEHGIRSSPICEIVENTPYAAAQEVGTRPFTPPFQAIYAWVLRQGKAMGMDTKSMLHAARRAEKDIKIALRRAASADKKAVTATKFWKKTGTLPSFSRKTGKSASHATKQEMHAADAAYWRESASASLGRKVAAWDPARQLAWRVWQSIRKRGIKAKWHTRDKALPKLRRLLGAAIRQYFSERRKAAA